ncbi:hypothetical protein [Streptomyces sp. MI02-7b]|uniref:hypothetical protein n=1 Tax=Streptomyces sp. MI02-7b TaxID=462941 RepID=UPI0029B1548E|nr:hypothetical protein [Streptomyces sp. MI02-7b]MDX3075859.1 hypothetical protein [Streptomyces sp. MI02-7b]
MADQSWPSAAGALPGHVRRPADLRVTGTGIGRLVSGGLLQALDGLPEMDQHVQVGQGLGLGGRVLAPGQALEGTTDEVTDEVVDRAGGERCDLLLAHPQGEVDARHAPTVGAHPCG